MPINTAHVPAYPVHGLLHTRVRDVEMERQDYPLYGIAIQIV